MRPARTPFNGAGSERTKRERRELFERLVSSGKVAVRFRCPVCGDAHSAAEHAEHEARARERIAAALRAGGRTDVAEALEARNGAAQAR
jgi:hypothetical protein